MSRPQRIYYAGAVYHIILRGNNGEGIFKNSADRIRFLGKLKYYKDKFKFKIYCFCLMINHAHIVIKVLSDIPTITDVMQPFNTSYAMYYNNLYKRKGHLFQDRFKGILVTKDEHLLELIRYIHLNPVRSKLVRSPDDYKWSSYNVYLRKRTMFDDLVDPEDLLMMFSPSKENRPAVVRDFVEVFSKARPRNREF